MRDDLYDLFQKIIILYKEKKNCLDQISTNEIQLRYLLNSDNTSGLFDMIQRDNDIFSKLTSIEFDIEKHISMICGIAGIEKNIFSKYFLSRTEDPLPELKKLKDDIDRHLSSLVSERDALLSGMEKKMADMKNDIDVLKKIRTLDFDRE